jgi:hypothetical protein
MVFLSIVYYDTINILSYSQAATNLQNCGLLNTVKLTDLGDGCAVVYSNATKRITLSYGVILHGSSLFLDLLVLLYTLYLFLEILSET